MEAVSDSTPLIHLAKINKIGYFLIMWIYTLLKVSQI